MRGIRWKRLFTTLTLTLSQWAFHYPHLANLARRAVEEKPRRK